MKALVLFVLLMAPVVAGATCDDTLKVQSYDILFSFSDPAPSSRVGSSPGDEREHFRRMAYALAAGQRALEKLAKRYEEFGSDSMPTVRAPVVLDARGRVVAPDRSNPNSVAIERICAGAVAESSCVLWTYEIGRFKTKAAAEAWLDRPPNRCDPDLVGNVEFHEVGPEALLLFSNCECTWEPGTFVVRTDSTWSARRGLFLFRGDAASAARQWRVDTGRKARVVQQRVDGAVLEQALRKPVGR